jgi:hypothetical protein
MDFAKTADGPEVKPSCVHKPRRSYDWKRPPHNKHRVTGTPSWLDQKEALPVFPLRKAHRNGSNPVGAQYPKEKILNLPPEACQTDYNPLADFPGDSVHPELSQLFHSLKGNHQKNLPSPQEKLQLLIHTWTYFFVDTLLGIRDT